MNDVSMSGVGLNQTNTPLIDEREQKLRMQALKGIV